MGGKAKKETRVNNKGKGDHGIEQRWVEEGQIDMYSDRYPFCPLNL